MFSTTTDTKMHVRKPKVIDMSASTGNNNILNTKHKLAKARAAAYASFKNANDS